MAAKWVGRVNEPDAMGWMARAAGTKELEI